jgi:hypothetical protein
MACGLDGDSRGGRGLRGETAGLKKGSEGELHCDLVEGFEGGGSGKTGR